MILNKITKDDMRKSYNQIKPSMVRYVHGALHRAMRDALESGMVSHNPVDGLKKVRVPRAERFVWTEEELRAFLAAAEKDRLFPYWRVLCSTGARKGEVLGLR